MEVEIIYLWGLPLLIECTGPAKTWLRASTDALETRLPTITPVCLWDLIETGFQPSLGRSILAHVLCRISFSRHTERSLFAFSQP